MSSMSKLTIELAHNTLAEQETRDQLLALLDAYPLERWRYTDRIRISDGEIPHSHPVLTLASHPDRTHPLRLISTYIHEQLHWFWLLETHGEHPFAAMEAFEQQFPEIAQVPVGPPDGCRSALSNRLHIAINYWELEGLGDLIGTENARAFIGNKPYYRAVYRLVLGRTEEIATILTANDMVLPPMPPAALRFVTPDR